MIAGPPQRNERIVFKRIVENSVGPTRPQYFLITPKLLQGLTAMDHPGGWGGCRVQGAGWVLEASCTP